jgi:hypothetical protein
MSDIVLILKHVEIMFLFVITFRFPVRAAEIPTILSSDILTRLR